MTSVSAIDPVRQEPSARPVHAGLYLHVPFCAYRCDYCDFNVLVGSDAAARRDYVAALRADLARVARGGPGAVAPPGAGDPPGEWPPFASVYVGGGTPTQLHADDLAGLVGFVGEVLPVRDDAEVTVEANPEDVTPGLAGALAQAGVTRLSIGAQSFAPRVLGFLGRVHGREAPLTAVAAARAAGIATVNLDLIYGAPGETSADWAATLRAAVDAGVEHLSAYALTLEANTPYATAVRRGARAAPDDDVAAERMAHAERRLGAAGFARYEISNWARPGAACRHNLGYWRGGDWLGVGAGAHGHWAGGQRSRRWWALRSPWRYTRAALAGQPTTAGQEILDPPARRAERLMLGLRLAEGVPRSAVEPVDERAVAELAGKGLLLDRAGRLTLTPAGRPLAGAVTLRLLP